MPWCHNHPNAPAAILLVFFRNIPALGKVSKLFSDPEKNMPLFSFYRNILNSNTFHVAINTDQSFAQF